MTTIAYKDGVIAYDSRCTRGSTITDDDCEKLETVKGVHFLCTGCTCDFDALIAAYFGAAASAPVEASGYAVDGGTLWLIGHDDKTGFWKNRIRLDTGDAIGSGSAFALAAMDMGATSAEAIEAAKRRDTSTGGRVRELRIRAEGVPQG
ncbi:proteasome subunit beta [Pseudomonas folii]|uniref:Proteasome subunit beta n=1 Tax=Pseudomonas folii TaxID=2762593 RepID=A0ABR7AVC7_9PSED|nr:proteasome subunit beta [Pseudomonas folii]MBC3948340.1 proteasome subunit beta [Pseudomonas folii]